MPDLPRSLSEVVPSVWVRADGVSGPDHGPATASSNLQRPRLWLILLLIYHGALTFSFLGSCRLLDHEDLAAARVQEMVATGRWMVPGINGQADVRKPPLPFWFSGAFSALAGGVNEWTVRIPSALASLGTMLLIVLWVRRLSGWRRALLAGFVFATSVASLQWGRRAEVDMQLCFWTTAALIAYWYAVNGHRRRQQVIYGMLMWSSLSLAVLTKGPLPLGIFVVAVLSVNVLCPRENQLSRMLPIAGPLIFCVITVPWGAYVELNYPGSLNTWYMQSIGRMTGELGYNKSWYFYVLTEPILLLPWVFLVGWGVYLVRRDKLLTRGTWIYLLAWGLGGLLLLSLSAGKRIHYALVTVPPLMVFAGLAADYVVFQMPKASTRLGRGIINAHGLAGCGLFIAIIAAAYNFPTVHRQFLCLGVLIGLGLGATYWLLVRGRRVFSLLCMAVVVLAGQLLLVRAIIPRVADLSDDNDFFVGRFIAENMDDADAVCFYDTFDAGLVFYARRRIPVLHSPDELSKWITERVDGYIIIQDDSLKEHRETFDSLKKIRFAANKVFLKTGQFLLLKFQTSKVKPRSKPHKVRTGGR